MVTLATLFSWWPIASSAQIIHASHDWNVADRLTTPPATFSPLLPEAEPPLGHHRQVALAWLPPENGVATSYILEAGTTPGASDVFNGNIALTTSIAGVVGPGTYYVRVRAVNAEGVSPPSNEVTVIVADGPPGKPTVTSAGVANSMLTVSWESGSGPTPSTHRLDFYSGGGLVATAAHGAETSFATAIPPSTMGTFGVRVTAFNGSIAGPPSELEIFSVESACHPLASPDVSGGVVGDIASVSWPAVPGATSYLLSAGSTPGGTQYLRETDIGATTTAGASVPAGFTAWVRVTAVNACGQRSAPRDFLVR